MMRRTGVGVACGWGVAVAGTGTGVGVRVGRIAIERFGSAVAVGRVFTAGKGVGDAAALVGVGRHLATAVAVGMPGSRG